MAYQPNKYRKFVATAATATLVAGAVAPLVSAATVSDFTDVAEQYKEAVSFLLEKDATKGISETQFGVYDNIIRQDAAVQLVKVLGLEVDLTETTTKYSDVPARTAPYVNALVKAGITNGKTETTFGANDQITRAELAVWIQKGFGLEGTGSVDFTDVPAQYQEAVAALKENGITQGINKTQFGTYDNATRGDYAIFLYRAANVEAPVEAPVVKTVEAMGTKTVVLTGTNLDQLTAKDITLSGNKVVSYTPSTDGTSATIVFESKFASGKEQTLKVNGESFKFTFEYNVSSVELDQGTYDDNKDGQQLTFHLNGSTEVADTEYLRQAGYKVSFVATDSYGGPAYIFDGDNNICNSGLLDRTNKIGDYTVEVQIEKDGKIVASAQQVISIVDVETATTAINSVELKNINGFVQRSSTLVIGESADVTKLLGNAGGKTNVKLPTELVEVSSSNNAVVSVSNKNGEIKLRANTAGTADVTFKIGKVTKTISLTVTAEAREVTTVTPSEDSFALVKDKERAIQIETLDQYGDPIDVFSFGGQKFTWPEYVVVDVPQTANHKKIVSVSPFATDYEGKTICGVTIEGKTVGEGTIYFKDLSGEKLGSVDVTVTDRDNHDTTVVEKTVGSLGLSDTFGVGSSVSYQVTHLNTDGAYNDNVHLNLKAHADEQAAYTVAAVDPTVAKVSLSHDKQSFTVTGLKEGSTDIKITDYAGNLKHKFTVTVTKEKVVTTKVTFKDTSETINYNGKKVTVADVLDVRADDRNDAIVYGLEHNVNTIAPVRLTSSYSFGWVKVNNPLKAYIDANDNGHYDNGDKVIAHVKAEVLTGSSTDRPEGIIKPDITDIRVDGKDVYTTAYGEEGTILFRVITDANGDGIFSDLETLASTTLNIDVPNK